MSRTAKVVAACGVISILAAALFFGFFFSQLDPRKMEGRIDEATADAQEFAESHDQADCLEQARQRDLGGSMTMALHMDEVQFAQVWATECLSHAEPTPGICDDVPDNVMLSGVWAQGECGADMGCQVAMQALVLQCLAAGFEESHDSASP